MLGSLITNTRNWCALTDSDADVARILTVLMPNADSDAEAEADSDAVRYSDANDADSDADDEADSILCWFWCRCDSDALADSDRYWEAIACWFWRRCWSWLRCTCWFWCRCWCRDSMRLRLRYAEAMRLQFWCRCCGWQIALADSDADRCWLWCGISDALCWFWCRYLMLTLMNAEADSYANVDADSWYAERWSWFLQLNRRSWDSDCDSRYTCWCNFWLAQWCRCRFRTDCDSDVVSDLWCEKLAEVDCDTICDLGLLWLVWRDLIWNHFWFWYRLWLQMMRFWFWLWHWLWFRNHTITIRIVT